MSLFQNPFQIKSIQQKVVDRFDVVLQSKRDKFQNEIRKSNHKKLFALKRQNILQKISLLNYEILEYIKSNNKFSQEQVVKSIEQIEKRSDLQDFNRKIVQLKLEQKILDFLLKNDDINLKKSLIKSLRYLTYYFQESCYKLNQIKIIKFLDSELRHYSFANQHHNNYLTEIVGLIKNLTADSYQLICNDIIELDLCSYLSRIILQDQFVSQENFSKNIKRLIKIRIHILNTVFNKNFSRQCLDFLLDSSADQFAEYEYCLLFVQILQNWPKKQRNHLQQMFHNQFLMIYICLEGIAQLILQKKNELKQALLNVIISSARILDIENSWLYIFPNNPKILINFLKDQNPKIRSKVLKVFELIITDFKQNVQQDDEITQIIIQTIKKSIDSNTNIFSSLIILYYLSMGNKWRNAPQIMLELNIMSRLQTFFKMQNLNPSNIQLGLQILSNLMNFGDSNSDGNKVKYIAHKLGIFLMIQELQDHKQKSIYNLAVNLMNEYGTPDPERD